jgi:hypothetical protein
LRVCGLDKAAKVGETVTFGRGIGRFYRKRTQPCVAVRSLDVDLPEPIAEVDLNLLSNRYVELWRRYGTETLLRAQPQ